MNSAVQPHDNRQRNPVDLRIKCKADQLDRMGERIELAHLVEQRARFRTRHSGYSAEEAKNIGKITKFMTPAKFSSCLTSDEISMPSAPSISPERMSAGSTVK